MDSGTCIPSCYNRGGDQHCYMQRKISQSKIWQDWMVMAAAAALTMTTARLLLNTLVSSYTDCSSFEGTSYFL